MADKTVLLVAGLGALYFLMRPGSAFAYPSTTTKPATGSGSSGSGGGFSMGSGSGGGSVTGGSGGSYQYKPTTGNTVINCPGSPGCPGYGVTDDSGNPCDPSSVTYDVQLCNVMNGTDSQNICDPASYYYDASQCTGSDVASEYPVDTGDPCDPSSYAYDATICSGVPNYGGGPSAFDTTADAEWSYT
jgi:hypothetical protein